MSDMVFEWICYIGKLLLMTLGTAALCGFFVRLLSRLFARLLGSGSGTVFDLTSVVGTPVHELGHALMCPLFGHRITRIRLWSPHAENGVYGYVEHSYNRRNPWAVMGNLFIGMGPIFSGLGVIVLMLWLCFPEQWNAYLAASHALTQEGVTFRELTAGVFSLFRTLPDAFCKNWWRSLLGVLIIFPVSLHVTLSWQDVKASLLALPMYLLLLAVFGAVTMACHVSEPILSALWLFQLRLLSLFCIVLAFSALWVLLAGAVRLARIIVGWF